MPFAFLCGWGLSVLEFLIVGDFCGRVYSDDWVLYDIYMDVDAARPVFNKQMKLFFSPKASLIAVEPNGLAGEESFENTCGSGLYFKTEY